MKRSKFAISIDKEIKAQKPGKRAANKNRETYYEYRENRADSDLRKKLEWGGTAESSKTGQSIGGENASSMYNTGGPLKGNQNKLDLNKNGKLDAEDFKMLRSKKMNTGGGVGDIGKPYSYDVAYEKGNGEKVKQTKVAYGHSKSEATENLKKFLTQKLKYKNLEILDVREGHEGIPKLGGQYGDKYAKGSTIEGDVVTYNDKKYKKQSNGKWLEISKHGLTKEEHSEKINEFAKKPNAHKEYGFHMSNRNKLSDKEYTEEQIGLNKDKKENGGELNETFPDTDAMSYKTGGAIKEELKEYGILDEMSAYDSFEDFYKEFKNYKKNAFEQYGEEVEDLSKKYTKAQLKKVWDSENNMAQGGSTKGFEYSIGGL